MKQKDRDEVQEMINYECHITQKKTETRIRAFFDWVLIGILGGAFFIIGALWLGAALCLFASACSLPFETVTINQFIILAGAILGGLAGIAAWCMDI